MISISRATTRLAIPISVISALAIAPSRLASQQGPTSTSGRLTLTEAWAKAESRNDHIAIASARSERAAGGALETSSFRKPRLSAFSAYDRTLRSEFDGLMGFSPDTTAPSDEESAEIPFGSAHAYRAGFTASYTVFSGGRGLAQSRAAAATRRSAEIGETTTRARVRLDVTEAYYDAMLAERLYAIASWTFDQAESTYRRVAMVSEAGRVAEFDVVRAKAMRDRQRPTVIQRRAERDIALLRLRQLLHVPAGTPLTLPADILDNLAAFPSLGGELGTREWVARRAAVRDATEAVTQREQALHASEAGRLPAVALTSTYERVAYPLAGTPSWKSSKANWTVGARLELPLVTGGRQRGSDMQARADLDAARARLRLTRDAAELDTRASLARLAAAEAAFEATRATVQEAERAYEIATLRYKEGMSIQLELSDARLLLEQARADQARAARDVSIERVRATLLSDLPLADQPPTT
jgi:outer membrane protein TolC